MHLFIGFTGRSRLIERVSGLCIPTDDKICMAWRWERLSKVSQLQEQKLCDASTGAFDIPTALPVL
jgi:hypothetical protein